MPGNSIVTLVNGDQIFPAMLKAIRGAQRSVDFETYVFWDGDIAREFSEALAERAQAGVKVNAILDAQGTSKMGSKNLSRLQSAGVNIEKYHSIFWWDIRRFNNRSHRKLLIIDGNIAFVGGVGIANEWTGNAQSPEHWRDNHYKVAGPVVAQLQGIFMDNWLKTGGSCYTVLSIFRRWPRSDLISRKDLRAHRVRVIITLTSCICWRLPPLREP